MNIHPAIVHFPIALLTLYGLFELVFFGNFHKQEWWFRTKAILLIFGTLGSFAALITGSMASKIIDMTPDKYELVKLHGTSALVVIVTFTLLSVLYVVRWLRKDKSTGWELFFFNSYIVNGFALIGLVAVFITGALGGAIIYGPDADPLVHFVYNLFFS